MSYCLYILGASLYKWRRKVSLFCLWQETNTRFNREYKHHIYHKHVRFPHITITVLNLTSLRKEMDIKWIWIQTKHTPADFISLSLQAFRRSALPGCRTRDVISVHRRKCELAGRGYQDGKYKTVILEKWIQDK